jgi:Tol biopolymer transport system component
MDNLKKSLVPILQIGALLALIAGLSLVLRLRPTAGENRPGSSQPYPVPAIQDVGEPYPAPHIEDGLVSPYPAPGEATPEALKPPPCQFPIFESITSSPALLPIDINRFSEPKVVLTSEMAINIAGWLPDSERLLITRDLLDGNRQWIETFNPKTSETQLFAERIGGGKPVWINATESVAFNTYVNDHFEVWVSYGSPEKIEQVGSDGIGLSISTDSKQLLLLSSSVVVQPQIWDTESKLAQPLPLSLKDWQYPKYSSDASLLTNISQASWSPDGSKIIFYTNPWLFMFDTNTGQICEIDLGEATWGEGRTLPRWAFDVQWSPNGRYLSLLTTAIEPGRLFPFSELMLLDVTTSSLQLIQFPWDNLSGKQYATDVTWSPDSAYLAAIAKLSFENGQAERGLFIVNPIASTAQRIPSIVSVGGGALGQQIAWSGDGSQIAVNCPTPEQGRLCIASVETHGAQP